MGFSVGDRVRVRESMADRYKQPWKDRIKRGLIGTIEGETNWGYQVRLDMPSRAKWPNDWFWRSVREDELEAAQ